MAEIMEIPPYFLCPITLDIMRDPVTLSTGITYERDSIERWIFTQKNATCPATKQPLLSLDRPNTTLRRLIQSWCTLHAATHGVERLPTPKPPLTRPHLLKILSAAAAAPHYLRTLKSLAADSQTNRRTMEAAGAAEFLAVLIVKSAAADNLTGTSEEALSIISAMQLSESGLKPLCNTGFVEALTLKSLEEFFMHT